MPDDYRGEMEILADTSALAEAAARRFVTLAREAVSSRGWLTVALSGGSTPHFLYTCLARSPYSGQVDWARVHFFWGDERCVLSDHADSNYGVARKALLDPLQIPPENVHRIRGELNPAQAVADYETHLRKFFGPQGWPWFDLVYLGLGDDGHTASLFPNSPALDEETRWAIAVEHTSPPPPFVSRVTLTLPILNAAANIIFLVSGPAKAARLAQVWQAIQGEDLLPTQRIRPDRGQLLWLVDKAAAARLVDPCS